MQPDPFRHPSIRARWTTSSICTSTGKAIGSEVVWTSGGINKLEVYRKLGMREVWFYERGKLRFFALRREAGDEVYREISRSEIVPELPIDVLLA